MTQVMQNEIDFTGKTCYTIHDALTHAIVKTATPTGSNLKMAAEEIAAVVADNSKTCRFYVHNGLGVIAAFATYGRNASQIDRQKYLAFDDEARAARVALNFPIDPKKA